MCRNLRRPQKRDAQTCTPSSLRVSFAILYCVQLCFGRKSTTVLLLLLCGDLHEHFVHLHVRVNSPSRKNNAGVLDGPIDIQVRLVHVKRAIEVQIPPCVRCRNEVGDGLPRYGDSGRGRVQARRHGPACSCSFASQSQSQRQSGRGKKKKKTISTHPRDFDSAPSNNHARTHPIQWMRRVRTVTYHDEGSGDGRCWPNAS